MLLLHFLLELKALPLNELEQVAQRQTHSDRRYAAEYPPYYLRVYYFSFMT